MLAPALLSLALVACDSDSGTPAQSSTTGLDEEISGTGADETSSTEPTTSSAEDSGTTVVPGTVGVGGDCSCYDLNAEPEACELDAIMPGCSDVSEVDCGPIYSCEDFSDFPESPEDCFPVVDDSTELECVFDALEAGTFPRFSVSRGTPKYREGEVYVPLSNGLSVAYSCGGTNGEYFVSVHPVEPIDASSVAGCREVLSESGHYLAAACLTELLQSADPEVFPSCG